VLARWLRLGTLALPALLGLVGAAGAAESTAPARNTGKTEPVDAEFLRDLDLLNSPDFARDREVAKRMRLLERLKELESWQASEGQPSGSPPKPAGQNPAAGTAPKEVK
jgi:hypothetical protein